MKKTVVILDDEPDRLDVMCPWLDRHFPDRPHVTFSNAPDIVEWLSVKLESCGLICLDHDLGPDIVRDGQRFDPGTGRDVADFLATRHPICPVVIHTTNLEARPGMVRVLQEAGWQTSFVTPYDDRLWIREVWAMEMRRLLR